jgi:hypothetical protein
VWTDSWFVPKPESSTNASPTYFDSLVLSTVMTVILGVDSLSEKKMRMKQSNQRNEPIVYPCPGSQIEIFHQSYCMILQRYHRVF